MHPSTKQSISREEPLSSSKRLRMSSPSSPAASTKQEPSDSDVEAHHTVIEGEEVVEDSPVPKEVQYVVIDKNDVSGPRGVLSRQPSYCKILKDLKEVEEDVVLKGAGAGDGPQQTETIEVTTTEAPVQTITINGQQYQIVSPASLNESSSSAVVQYAATANSNGQTVFIPGTLSSSSGATAATNTNPASSPSQVITVSPPASVNNSVAEDASRKREIRLLKNREAARECRNKKKEYIRCLENRVAVLENQNKALIEELKSLKELYTGQKN